MHSGNVLHLGPAANAPHLDQVTLPSQGRDYLRARSAASSCTAIRPRDNAMTP